MKKTKVLLVVMLVSVLALTVIGCSSQGGGGGTSETVTTSTLSSGTSTTITGTSSTTTTTYSYTSGYQTPNDYFNVSGAQSVASAALLSSTGIMKAQTTATANDLVKFTADGSAESIINTGSSYYYSHPTISVIETDPFGALYIGFANSVYLNVNGTLKSVAFFKIFPNTGTVEVVDEDVTGIGSWNNYYSSYQGELPQKQVQFDRDGNVYYLASSGYGSNILKKKTPEGVISQIGTSNMTIYNFLVCADGTVLFQGANSGDTTAYWLRAIKGSNVSNIYYNSNTMSYGYLRSYYTAEYNGHTYVILVGTNLPTFVNEVSQNVSGVFKFQLEDGVPISMEAVLDDNNMYSYSWGTIGDQLINGYWDYSSATYHRYFCNDASGYLQLPLVLSSEASEDSIRAYIRGKYKSITSDTLDSVSFEGLTSTETPTWDYQKNSMAIAALNAVVAANISGTTWADWRSANGFDSGIYFGNAKQILFNDGWLGGIIDKDGWYSSTGTKGDAVLQLITASGQTSIEVFPQNSTRKDISRARAHSHYVVYSAAAGGYYKLFRLDTNDPAAAPVDLTASKGNLEIYTFNYNALNNMLPTNCYEYGTNSMKLYNIALDDAIISSEVTAEGYSSFIDIVPFVENLLTTTTTTSTSTTTVTESTTTTITETSTTLGETSTTITETTTTTDTTTTT